ncbi:MAG: cell envelope integrity protein TolA, partial [Lachnospiraceae bacterium]|nr:cell envelope integrity protein TolA [Lachnospiraceae bacterium]
MKKNQKVDLHAHVDEKWIDWYQERKEAYLKMKEQKRKRTFAVVSALAAVLILGFFGLVVHQAIKRNQGAPGQEPIPITASSEDQENTADSGTSLQNDSTSEEAAELSRQEEESVAREVEEQSRQEAERLARESEEQSRQEAERLARESEEQSRQEAERLARESEERSRQEAERLSREAEEAARQASIIEEEEARMRAIEESRALEEAERKRREWETSPIPATKLDLQEARTYFTNPVSFEDAKWPPENEPEGLREFLSIYFSLYEDPREDLGFTFVSDDIVRYWKTWYKYPHADDWSVDQGKNCIEEIIYNDGGLILASVKYKDILHLVNVDTRPETGWSISADYGRAYGDESYGMGPDFDFADLAALYRTLLTRQEGIMPLTAENLSAAEENLKAALLDKALYELLPDDAAEDLYNKGITAIGPLRDYIPEGKTDEYLASVKVFYDHDSSLDTLVDRCIYPGWNINNINAAFVVVFHDAPSLVIEGYDKDFKPEDR